MSKNFKFLQLFGRLNELVSQKWHKTQQIFLPKSNHCFMPTRYIVYCALIVNRPVNS